MQLGILLFLGLMGGSACLLVRTVFRAWLRHQLRLALLARLEQDPPPPGRESAVEQLLRDLTPVIRSPRQDYRITGLILAVLGLASVWTGKTILTGTLAVGLYEGGVVCCLLGIMIALPALVGAAVRSVRVRSAQVRARS